MDYVQARLEVLLRQVVPDDFRRALDVGTGIENKASPVVKQEGVDKVPLGKTEVGEDVLGIQVEGPREGLPHLPGHPDNHVFQRHRLLDVDDVSPAEGFGNLIPFDLGVRKTVGINDGFEDRELEVPQREIGLGAVGVGVADRHQAGVHAVLPKLADRIVDGNAQTVSGIVCIVTYKQYLHLKSLMERKDTLFSWKGHCPKKVKRTPKKIRSLK